MAIIVLNRYPGRAQRHAKNGPNQLLYLAMTEHRRYSDVERAEAVALAATIGPKRAAIKLGLPPKTVSNWLHRPSSSVIIAAAEYSIAQRLKEAHELALAVVVEGLRDPKSRLSDRAAALRTLGEQLALAEGRATSNVDVHGQERQSLLQGFDEEQRDYIRAWLLSVSHGPEWADMDMAALEEGRIGPEAAAVLSNHLREAEELIALQAALTNPLDMDRDQILAAIRAIEHKIGPTDG